MKLKTYSHLLKRVKENLAAISEQTNAAFLEVHNHCTEMMEWT